MNIQLSTYNFLAIFGPGALVLCLVLSADAREFRFIKDSVLLTIVISICLGEIIQSFGNMLEAITKFPRRFTDNKLKNNGIELPYNEVYRLLKENNLTDRLDIYVEKYGLLRGMLVVALLLALFCFTAMIYGIICYGEFCARNFCNIGGITILLSFFCYLIAYRLYHFASLYTDEMIVQYNNYKAQKEKKEGKASNSNCEKQEFCCMWISHK